MYAFLDRAAPELDEPHRFLLAAMPLWVASARAGACPCRALLRGFVERGVPQAVRDFGMAMATLDREGLETLRFGEQGAVRVREDEARLLELFDAGFAFDAPRVRRIAATLVAPDAAERLATAAQWIALHVGEGHVVERRA